MPVPVRQADMDAVFRVTDELGIHRESVTVPLARQDPGEVRDMGSGQLRIMLPESEDPEAWTEGTLRQELEKLGYEPLP